ncbi:hypothetical protein QQY66_02280 [Streptomyces sp. DG2A-72]|uniref:hypothetical protein n=1 Tax=Streptomyces sp. DG2A-72 TaxID=3051386 RepID=UPI00265BDB72|nr:hypothetical protein [Streptomyces sp. DG2A-72]MDO0930568.1 hypothetical protein [Streptomyces sp. DG2A-72]
MTRDRRQDDQLPIYEGLVRECGDVLAEARQASQQVLHQAAALLGSGAARPEQQRERQDFSA